MRDIVIGVAYSLAASTVALSVLPNYAERAREEASWMITAINPVSRAAQESESASPILFVRKHEKLPE